MSRQTFCGRELKREHMIKLPFPFKRSTCLMPVVFPITKPVQGKACLASCFTRHHTTLSQPKSRTGHKINGQCFTRAKSEDGTSLIKRDNGPARIV